ncbi:MAG: hypothetical protein J0L55_10815 [Caulobacterales bacterium]|nr:hypothetical protein [Caulobacterales bacterium]MCA0373147.1 hypothetical protein [Pseudomonadota bacterium]
MFFAELFQRISSIVGVPVNILIIVPLVLALSFHIIKKSENTKNFATYSRSKMERKYLHQKNDSVAILSLALLIVSGYVSYVTFQTRNIPKIEIENLRLRN